MIITNDVSLITFVPFAIMMLKQCGRQELMIPVVVLQTIAANLGSMLTPIGNPQNLYLYGLAGTGIGEFIMWLLPYTIASALLLVISILLIKNKNEIICIEDTDSEAAHNTSVPRVMAYSVLFVLALLVVARVLTWYILAAAVLITVLLLEKNVLAKADYALLLTFIGFFIFTGNMGRVEPVAHFLAGIVNSRELEVGIITSQCISNVPAALLLSGFTDNIKNLSIGVNIGGLGTLIASMASLISYKLYANEVPVVNNFIVPGNMKGLIIAVCGMGVMYACGALSTLGYNRLMVHTSQKVVSEIRMDLFKHTQKLPLKYFDNNTHGEIMSHFTNDVDTVQEAMNNSFAMVIQSFLTLFGTITMMMVLSVRLTMIVVVFLILMFIFIKYNGKRSKKYYHRQQKELGNINGFVQEMMAGQKVEKVFNHEQKNFEKFCEMNESFRKESTNALAYSGMLIPVIVSLSYFNYALSACVGGIFVIKGIMDLGSISAYLVYVRQSAMPLNQFTQQVNFILSALSGAERIFDMMDEAEEPDEGKVTLCNVIKNADNTLTETSDKTGFFAWKLPAGELIELKGDVRFNDVVFGYVPEKRVLNKISLFAKPGHKIAFVGSTGAGKTTIVNLINRFYDIQSGTITYDGIDVKDIKKDDLRRSLAMVIQDTHLFTGTIADNIRYGKLDATDEEIREAAKIANADSFITRLPRGYDTMLTADGSNLSQGSGKPH